MWAQILGVGFGPSSLKVKKQVEQANVLPAIDHSVLVVRVSHEFFEVFTT